MIILTSNQNWYDRKIIVLNLYIYSKIKLNSKIILKYSFFIIKKRKILTVPTLYIHFLALEWKSAICDGYEICSVVSVA